MESSTRDEAVRLSLERVGEATDETMTGLVVDNYFFGIASVSEEGDESPVAFPSPAR